MISNVLPASAPAVSFTDGFQGRKPVPGFFRPESSIATCILCTSRKRLVEIRRRPDLRASGGEQSCNTEDRS
jgi:hypothetical protein